MWQAIRLDVGLRAKTRMLLPFVKDRRWYRLWCTLAELLDASDYSLPQSDCEGEWAESEAVGRELI
jgi:hypothetical protein